MSKYADAAHDLYEWLQNQPTGTYFTRGFMAGQVGMGQGTGFTRVLQMVSTLAAVDGLTLEYPLQQNNWRGYRLTRSTDRSAGVLVHLNASRHGNERRAREVLRGLEANHPVGAALAVAHLTRIEMDALDGARQLAAAESQEMSSRIEELARRLNRAV